MKYYLKRLGHQELGSVKNGKAQRGRYIYISKDKNVLDIFPPLSKTVTNDSSIIPIIPLYQKIAKKIYCNYIYHNDKYNVSGGTRNEYRIYCNGALEGKQLLFQPDDILIFRAKKTSSLPKDILGSNDVPEAAVEEANVFFLYRCCDKNSELYRMCKKLVDESNIRGNGHAIYQGIITEVENKINQLCVKNFNEMDTVIEDTVTAKAQSGDIDEMASLFNSVSFRDFVMTGYKQKCAITGNVIQYKSFMNLEAAHIWPRSHKGLYLPSNGIALCRDMHWAFDKGMFTIGDDFKVIVHPDVESDYLQQYNNKSLYIPENAFFRPDINNLHYHQTHIYGLFNGNWKVCHKEELLNQCKNKLFDDSIGKLLEAVESILRQKSKCVASKMPYFIPVSGEYDNSLELRGNLVKSLCWVKKNLSELSQCNQEKIENNIYTLLFGHN